VKPWMTIVVLAGLPAFAQINASQPAARPPVTTAKAPAAAPVVTSSGTPRPARMLLRGIERQFDDKIAGADVNDRIDLLGQTRSIYLDGYGAVFTTELSLIETPGTSSFRPSFSDAEKTAIHDRKLKHLALLKTLMKEMMTTTAGALDSVSFNDQIVLQVRMLYLPWENVTGLPAQITMQGNRKSVLASLIQTTEEK
jgi:hypothetical protein